MNFVFFSHVWGNGVWRAQVHVFILIFVLDFKPWWLFRKSDSMEMLSLLTIRCDFLDLCQKDKPVYTFLLCYEKSTHPVTAEPLEWATFIELKPTRKRSFLGNVINIIRLGNINGTTLQIYIPNFTCQYDTSFFHYYFVFSCCQAATFLLLLLLF